MQLNKISEYLNFKTSAKLLSCGLLVVVADFLFYDQRIGWTLGLFGFLMLVLTTVHNKAVLNHKVASIAFLASFGLVFALIESPNILACWMYYLTLILTMLLPKMRHIDDAKMIAKVILRYVLTSWWNLQRDSVIIAYARKRWQKTSGRKRTFIRNWLLPISLSSVFIMLFSQANPIITSWLSNIRWDIITEYYSLPRALFWLFVACISWALVRPKLRAKQYHEQSYNYQNKEFTLMALLFNERSVLTSLILFNGLFLIQNLLDIAFLWSGAELPAGMTHAQYARQGAYPLIATALLTAVFVLIAFKPHSIIEQNKTICTLVYIWVGQNVFLVFSSITRLMNYIEEYSLTYMRVSALIWMVLVALGLTLIVTRIFLQKSNKWLLNSNSIALYITLYLCCFINFGGIIADYNVKHSHEVTGKGVFLDTYHLQNEIGVDAIPALLWFEQNKPDSYNYQRIQEIRKQLQAEITYSITNWRQWTFRNYRLTLRIKEIKEY